MTIYITRGNYSEHALQGMIRQPENRQEVVEQLITAAGGKMLAYYMTLGEYDFLIISEFDNEVDGLSTLMVAAGTGGVRNLNTTVAITTTEARKAEDKAGKLASNFQPAGG